MLEPGNVYCATSSSANANANFCATASYANYCATASYANYCATASYSDNGNANHGRAKHGIAHDAISDKDISTSGKANAEKKYRNTGEYSQASVGHQ